MSLAARPGGLAMDRYFGAGSMRKGQRNAGFTYLGILFFVATMGIVLAVTGVIWSTANQREKERELLFVGHEFRKAIAAYYERSPGTVKRYPANFNDLLKDNRQLATVRHLRRLHADPMTSRPEWGIVKAPDNGIMGVYSLSTQVPIKRSNFLIRDTSFENADKYSQWRFVYEPTTQTLQSPPKRENF
jgi:type II secretory pathway pseudopilin PulG